MIPLGEFVALFICAVLTLSLLFGPPTSRFPKADDAVASRSPWRGSFFLRGSRLARPAYSRPMREQLRSASWKCRSVGCKTVKRSCRSCAFYNRQLRKTKQAGKNNGLISDSDGRSACAQPAANAILGEPPE
jgi:hypothetical protein